MEIKCPKCGSENLGIEVQQKGTASITKIDDDGTVWTEYTKWEDSYITKDGQDNALLWCLDCNQVFLKEGLYD